MNYWDSVADAGLLEVVKSLSSGLGVSSVTRDTKYFVLSFNNGEKLSIHKDDLFSSPTVADVQAKLKAYVESFKNP